MVMPVRVRGLTDLAGGCTLVHMTTAAYRKTKSGEWVAFGPAASITAGATVTIAKRDGTIKTERIARVGKVFRVDGREMVYGYLVATRSASTSQPGNSGTCDECGRRSPRLVECGDSSGLGGMCCPRCAAGPWYTRSFA